MPGVTMARSPRPRARDRRRPDEPRRRRPARQGRLHDDAGRAARRGEGLTGNGADAIVLRQDTSYVIHDAGASRCTSIGVLAILDNSAADSFDTPSLSYSPSYQDKPTFRARVIAPDGKATDVEDERQRQPEQRQRQRGVDLHRLDVRLPAWSPAR